MISLMYVDRALEACLYSDNKPSRRVLGWVLAAVFGAALCVMIWLGPTPISGPWDVVSFLNGSWRMCSGQIPHIDYHNPVGPLTYLQIVFGMKIAGPSTAAFVYGIVLAAVVLIPWAWGVASSRLQPMVAFIYVLFCGFLLISPRPLGYGVRETTYAMLYNRECYVLLSVLLVGLFLPRRALAGHAAMFDGLSIGLLLALMLYCKITYFGVAAASTLLGIVLTRRPLVWFFGVAAGFLGVCVAFYILFHINLRAYLSDIAMSAQSQSPAMRIELLKQGLRNNLLWIYLAFVCLCFWTYVDQSSPKSPRSSFRLWLTAAWILTIALCVEAGNAAQRGGVEDPIYFVAGLVVLESFRRRNWEQMQAMKSQARLMHAASVLLVLSLFCLPILARDIASFSYSSAWNLVRRPSFDASRRIRAGPLRDLLVPASTQHITEYWPARDFPLRINEGLDLLRRHLSKGDTVTVMGFTDPFSFALGITPARDENQWWHLDFTFDRRNHPSPTQFLGSVSLVVVPRNFDNVQGRGFENVDAMLEIYGNYLQANFAQVDSSEAWSLYRRR